MFSPRQQGIFRPLVHRAWVLHCERAALDPFNKIDRDSWYRGELLRVIGVGSTKDCDQVKDFDTVLAHFAVMAEDEYWIAKLARAAEDRMVWLIRERLAELDKIEHHPNGWEYVVSIYKHMHLPADMGDCPAQLLWKVFQALDTHVRRHHGGGHHEEVHPALAS